MTENFNRVTCPKCGYEENPTTAKKCEICGQVLKKGNSLAPLLAGTAAAALLGTLGYLGYGLVKDSRQAQAPAPSPQAANAPSPSPGPTVAIPSAVPGGQSMDTAALISWGGQVLFKDIPGADMAAGAAAYAQGDYPTAASHFQRVRQAARGEPEALIYLNNARLGATPALGVAAVVPISDTANAARELLRGVAQAQDEAIKAGMPIKVLIADDNNNPDQARAIAAALSQDPAIMGVIGHGTSTTTLVAAPIYQQAGLPMIAPTSTSTELAALPRSGPNLIFRVIASDQFTGTALARHLLSRKQQKPIVFYNSQSSYSTSLLEALSTTIGLEGGQVVKTVDLSQGSPAGELQGTDADSLVLLPDSKSFEARSRWLEPIRAGCPWWPEMPFTALKPWSRPGPACRGQCWRCPGILASRTPSLPRPPPNSGAETLTGAPPSATMPCRCCRPPPPRGMLPPPCLLPKPAKPWPRPWGPQASPPPGLPVRLVSCPPAIATVPLPWSGWNLDNGLARVLISSLFS